MIEFIESFTRIFIEFIANTLLDYFNENLIIAADLAFDAESEIASFVGSLDGLLKSVYIFGIGFLTIKFIVKAINIYMLRVDGDPDADPLILVTNFFKAMIISICFGIMYSYFIAIIRSFLQTLLDSINLDMNNLDELSVLMSGATSLGPVVLICIYLIIYTVLMIMFIIKGVQLMILRYGIVIATVGLLDSDGGSWKPYSKKFFQIAFTIVLQVILFQLSIPLIASAHYFYGIAILATAITAPKFLNEFIMVGQGSPTQALYSANLISGMFRKGA